MTEISDEELKALLIKRGIIKPQSQPSDEDLSNEEIKSEIASRANSSKPSMFDNLVGGAEGALSMVSGMGATAAGGLYGIASASNPLAEQGAGAKNSQWVQDTFTYEPKTEAGKQAIQQFGDAIAPAINWLEEKKLSLGEGMPGDNAVLATLGHMSPDLILSILGLPKGFKPKSVPIRGRENPLMRGANIPDEQTKVAEVIQKSKNPKDVSSMVNPDPNFYKAVDNLGMTEQPLASFGSKNNQFVSIESAIASANTFLDDATKRFIGELSTKADGLIEKFGGFKDKAEFDQKFATNVKEVIDTSFDTEGKLYSSIAEKIGLSTRHNSEKTIAFLEQKATELGGVNELPPKLRTLYNKLKPKTDKDGNTIYPTAGKIDFERKQVGQSLHKKKGAYADEEEGLLKALYGNMAEDMNNIASKSGKDVVAMRDIAKGLTQNRKALEDANINLVGRNLDKSVSQQVGVAIRGLEKGMVTKFDNLISLIPDGMRQEAIMTAMNTVFRGNAVGKQALDVTQFTKWYQNLNRSPKSKAALFKYLPQEAQKSLESLYTVSSGVSKALGEKVSTGRLNALFNPDIGFMKGIVGKALPMVVGYATSSPISSMATNVTMQAISKASNGTQRAADVLASPQFQAIIKKAVREGVEQGTKKPSTFLQKQADKFTKSQTYKDWYQELKESERSAIASKGLIGYLFVDEEKK